MGMLIDLDAYSVGRLQDMIGILDQASAAGLTVEGLRDAVARHVNGAEQVAPGRSVQVKKSRPTARQAGRKMTVPCNQGGCTGSMLLYSVNISKCTHVGGPWKTQAICRRCGHEEYSVLNVAEIFKAGRI